MIKKREKYIWIIGIIKEINKGHITVPEVAKHLNISVQEAYAKMSRLVFWNMIKVINKKRLQKYKVTDLGEEIGNWGQEFINIYYIKSKDKYCDHPLLYWSAMPYDEKKGGAYYKLRCKICNQLFKHETFLCDNSGAFEGGKYKLEKDNINL